MDTEKKVLLNLLHFIDQVTAWNRIIWIQIHLLNWCTVYFQKWAGSRWFYFMPPLDKIKRSKFNTHFFGGLIGSIVDYWWGKKKTADSRQQEHTRVGSGHWSKFDLKKPFITWLNHQRSFNPKYFFKFSNLQHLCLHRNKKTEEVVKTLNCHHAFHLFSAKYSNQPPTPPPLLTHTPCVAFLFF